MTTSLDVHPFGKIMTNSRSKKILFGVIHVKIIYKKIQRGGVWKDQDTI